MKAYAPELGSAWVQQEIDPSSGNLTLISQLTLPEVSTAFARKQREGALDHSQADQLRQDFLRDFTSLYAQVVVRLDILQTAADLTRRHPLGGCDAVHLATALILNAERVGHTLSSIVFVSADNQLCNGARLDGLLVENPNLHP